MVSPLAGGQLGRAESDFIVVEWSDSGAAEWEWIAPLHVHHADDEAWYVLEGTLRFRLGDETFEASAGSAVLAAKGTPHAYGNARKGERARYLLVMTPEDPGTRGGASRAWSRGYAEIFRAHDSELLP